MEVIIDGNTGKIKASDTDTLADVLAASSGLLLEEDRFIVSIKLDGRELTDDSIDKHGTSPVHGFKKLVFESQPRGALAKSALEETRFLLDSLAADHKVIALSAIQGLGKEVKDSVEQVTAKWQLASETLVGVPSKLYSHAPDIVQDSLNILLEPLDKMKSTLLELHKAIGNIDFLLVADIVKYDLSSLAEIFIDASEKIAGLIDGGIKSGDTIFNSSKSNNEGIKSRVPRSNSSALFDANWKLLEANHPGVAEKLRDVPPLPASDTPQARRGMPTLLADTPEGRRIHLHSSVDPVDEAKSIIDEHEIGSIGTVIVFGAALGYHLAELATRITSENNVIVVEKDLPRFRTALEKVDLTGLLSHPRVKFLFDPDELSFSEIFRAEIEDMLITVRFIVHHPSMRIDYDFYMAAMDTAKKAVSGGAVTLRTAYALARRSLKNRLGNMPEYLLSPGIKSLKSRFKGKPGVVVSAGPSLARNIDQLADLKGRAVIVAVATTFKVLLGRGIEPDFAVVLDYNRISKQHFDDIPASVNVPLVTDPKANPDAVNVYRGPKLFVEDDMLRALSGASEGKGRLAMGATVAHTAVSFLEYIGCDPIVLVGQDFAFTDGLTHLPGTGIYDRIHGEVNRFNTCEMFEHETLCRSKHYLKKAKDIHGRETNSSDNLISYRQDFEDMFGKLGCRVLNATEGGLPIRGAETVLLSDVIKEFADSSIAPDTFSMDTDFADFAGRLPEAARRMNEVRESSRALGKLYGEALAILRRINNRLKHDKDVDALVEEVHEIKAQFGQYEIIYQILLNIARSDLRQRLIDDRHLAIEDLTGRELQAVQARRDIAYLDGLYNAERHFRRELEKALAVLDEKDGKC